MAGTRIVPVVDEGLGNSAYLVDLGEGRALAVDVPRDLRAVRAAAGRHGLTAALAPLTTGQVRMMHNDGAQPIDVRPVPAYVAGHIPGSLAIPPRDASTGLALETSA